MSLSSHFDKKLTHFRNRVCVVFSSTHPQGGNISLIGCLEHDPEKWVPAFRRSSSRKKTERDGDFDEKPSCSSAAARTLSPVASRGWSVFQPSGCRFALGKRVKYEIEPRFRFNQNGKGSSLRLNKWSDPETDAFGFAGCRW
jgi:hypothetical protein